MNCGFRSELGEGAFESPPLEIQNEEVRHSERNYLCVDADRWRLLLVFAAATVCAATAAD